MAQATLALLPFGLRADPAIHSQFTGASSWLPCSTSRLRGLRRPDCICKDAQQVQEESLGGCFCEKAYQKEAVASSSRTKCRCTHPPSCLSFCHAPGCSPQHLRFELAPPGPDRRTTSSLKSLFPKGHNPHPKTSNGSVLSHLAEFSPHLAFKAF